MKIIRKNGYVIIGISDTHGKHRELDIPSCNILICCGDICTDGNLDEIKDFFKWFSEQPGLTKVFTPGNHDLPFELEPDSAFNLIPEDVLFLKNEK